MRRTRASGRKDGNHKELADHAVSLGMSVMDVSDLTGQLDLVVGVMGVDVRVEIKDGSNSPSKQRLTGPERDTIAGWKGRKPVIWKSKADVEATRDKILKEAVAVSSPLYE